MESSDNRLFNVSGKSKEMLRDTIRLAFKQCGDKCKALTWIETPENGLILSEYDISSNEKAYKFVTELTADTTVEIVWEWLEKADLSKFILIDWESDCDHDGHNGKGWRCYVGDWGITGGLDGAICAIKPIYLWYGK